LTVFYFSKFMVNQNFVFWNFDLIIEIDFSKIFNFRIYFERYFYRKHFGI